MDSKKKRNEEKYHDSKEKRKEEKTKKIENKIYGINKVSKKEKWK